MATWKDITIDKYNAILALKEKEYVSETDLIASIIAVIEDTTVDKVEEMPYAVLILKARGIRFLQNNPCLQSSRKVMNLTALSTYRHSTPPNLRRLST